jgi:hypothetical protein
MNKNELLNKLPLIICKFSETKRNYRLDYSYNYSFCIKRTDDDGDSGAYTIDECNDLQSIKDPSIIIREYIVAYKKISKCLKRMKINEKARYYRW